MARIADRTAERFAESAQLTDRIAARNTDQFAESRKVSDRNAKRFGDRFTKRVQNDSFSQHGLQIDLQSVLLCVSDFYF